MSEFDSDDSDEDSGANLSDVATSVLERLCEAVALGRLRAPITRADLASIGIRHQVDAIAATLEGHTSLACEAILDLTLDQISFNKIILFSSLPSD